MGGVGPFWLNCAAIGVERLRELYGGLRVRMLSGF